MTTMSPASLERAVMIECSGERLLGILHEPAVRADGKPGVVVVVGGPQYRVGSHRQFVTLARALAGAGYPVLRFDYRGMGDSSGAQRKFDAVDADIRSAVDVLLASQTDLRGVVLWGLCDAASASLIYCSRDERIVGLILANPWVHTDVAEAQSYLRHYYLRRLLQPSFWTKLLSLRVGVRASIGDFLRKLARARRGDAGSPNPETRNFIGRMLDGLKSFGGPVLVLLSERDLTARQFQDLAEAPGEWLRAMSRANVSVDSVAGADHTFSNREGLDSATDRCLSWLARTIDAGTR